MIKKTYKRKWLNKRQGRAFIELETGLDSSLGGYKLGKDLYGYDAYLTIGDCSRHITLEFDVWIGQTKTQVLKDLRGRKHKVEAFKKFLAKIEGDLNHLEENIDDYLKLTKKEKKKNGGS